MRTKTQQNQHAVRVGKKKAARRIVAKRNVQENRDKDKAEKLRAIRERKALAKEQANYRAEMMRRRHQLATNMGKEPVKLAKVTDVTSTEEKKAESFLRRILPFTRKKS